ncbi:hypothetical protein EAD96_21585 [Micromonospora sp. BL1]|uniref:hypothetical protein n=1 Tax=Micromonospora sp. BL1 TaxID=2478709 RepID=UPI000EF60B66|nr:hypothetical protein [Micromonospora sp. BL1]NED51519.1 hypothetical protein [Micromonospora aurantiaca]RLQ02894.1 hypothetical protein EAD96_21585 [Micromonospora sp. BL1]
MEKRYAVAALALVTLLAGCTSDASHDEQMEYLRTMAQRGAELHAVEKSRPSGSPGDAEECSDSYENIYGGLNGHDAPHVGNYDEKVALVKEGRRLFMESCMSGTPSSAQGASREPRRQNS